MESEVPPGPESGGVASTSRPISWTLRWGV